jgi:hypothetical protein
VLVVGDVDPGDTCHCLSSSQFADAGLSCA